MIRWLVLIVFLFSVAESAALEAPRGFYPQLEIVYQGQRLSFGPFVGYYFKPTQGADLRKLEFRCYNERQYYTDQLPAETLLFRGEALLRRLPAVRAIPSGGQRITPLFFADAPAQWLQARPLPQAEFVHFHSAYSATGPSYSGYWLRHEAAQPFVYNMGGRVGKNSPLYHRAVPGQNEVFPHIIEFDRGP